MSDRSTARPTIGAASIFQQFTTPPGSLDTTIPFNGKRIFCDVEPRGSLLVFHIRDTATTDIPVHIGERPEVLPAISGDPTTFTTASLDISYDGKTSQLRNPQQITYTGNSFRFGLRFDRFFQNAAIYIIEEPPSIQAPSAAPEAVANDGAADSSAVAEAALEQMGRIAANPLEGLLHFIALEDNLIPALPYSAVYIHNRIFIPQEHVGKAAAPIIFKEDGGSEAGPMGFRVG